MRFLRDRRVGLTVDQAVRGRALAVDVELCLCSWARHLTLTEPLSTQVYGWVPANLLLRGTPPMDLHSVQRGVKIFVVASYYRDQRKTARWWATSLVCRPYLYVNKEVGMYRAIGMLFSAVRAIASCLRPGGELDSNSNQILLGLLFLMEPVQRPAQMSRLAKAFSWLTPSPEGKNQSKNIVFPFSVIRVIVQFRLLIKTATPDSLWDS